MHALTFPPPSSLEQKGRINFNLFNTVVPKTVENFAQLCEGSHSPQHTYKGSAFHRVIPGFMLQGGDFTRGNVRRPARLQSSASSSPCIGHRWRLHLWREICR